MKKALIVLLILAVAGGLFAQVTFSGSVQTGLAIGFSDEDGDAGAPKVDYIRNRGEHGIRADFTMKYASPTDADYGPWGAEFVLRGRQNNILDKGTANSITAQVPTAKAWWQPASILYLAFGTGGPGGFGTMGAIDRSFDIMDNNGLGVRLDPIPGLSIGGQAYYGQSLKLVKDMNYGLGAKFALADVVTVVANMRYFAENKDNDAKPTIDLGAGANLAMLSGIGLNKLAVDVGTFNLSTDDFFIGFGPAIGFGIGDLSLGAKAGLYLGMGDNLADFMPMYFHVDASYKIGIAKIGAEGRYAMGGAPSLTNYRPAGEDFGVDSAASFANKDGKGFAISPYVELSVGPTIVLGYNFRKNLTDGAAGRTSESMIYAGVNLSF